MKIYINKLAKTVIALLFSCTVINQNIIAMMKKRLTIIRPKLNTSENTPPILVTPNRKMQHTCIPEVEINEFFYKQELVMVETISKYLQERKMLLSIKSCQYNKHILSNKDIALELYVDTVVELFVLSDDAIDHTISEVRQFELPIKPEDRLDIIDILTILKTIP